MQIEFSEQQTVYPTTARFVMRRRSKLCSDVCPHKTRQDTREPPYCRLGLVKSSTLSAYPTAERFVMKRRSKLCNMQTQDSSTQTIDAVNLSGSHTKLKHTKTQHMGVADTHHTHTQGSM